MPRYVRAHQPGGTFFFTVVSYRRRKIMVEPDFRLALRQAIADTRSRYPFSIDAWVLLPDHLHCILSFPESDPNFSRVWGLIKSTTSRRLKPVLPVAESQSRSRERKGELPVWQRRFWEHQIRDERDLRTHLDYVHYNPVKHGWVSRVCDWPFSTFHRYVECDFYPEDWGGGVVPEGEFGE